MSEGPPENPAPQPEPESAAVTPFLFAEGDMPERPDLVELVRQGAHKTFTGERLARDKELCRAIVADLLLGLSERAIARKYRVSRNSILGIERRLRATGEMESVKSQVLADLDDVILIGLRTWKQNLLEGKIPAGQVPIPVLAALDKKVQLEAGVVLGTGRTERELSTDDLAAAWEKIKNVTPVMVKDGAIVDLPTPTVENVSTADASIHCPSDPVSQLAVDLDGVGPSVDPLPAPAAAADPAAAAPPAPAEGGGGGSPPRGPRGDIHTHSDDPAAPPKDYGKY